LHSPLLRLTIGKRLAGWPLHDRFRLQVKRRDTLAGQPVPLADVPAAKRSNAGLVAASWPIRLEAWGEPQLGGSCWSSSLAAANASWYRPRPLRKTAVAQRARLSPIPSPLAAKSLVAEVIS